MLVALRPEGLTTVTFVPFSEVTRPEHAYRMLMLFLLYEACIGMFTPVMGIMRSKYIPDDMRTTVMQLFRRVGNFGKYSCVHWCEVLVMDSQQRRVQWVGGVAVLIMVSILTA